MHQRSPFFLVFVLHGLAPQVAFAQPEAPAGDTESTETDQVRRADRVPPAEQAPRTEQTPRAEQDQVPAGNRISDEPVPSAEQDPSLSTGGSTDGALLDGPAPQEVESSRAAVDAEERLRRLEQRLVEQQAQIDALIAARDEAAKNEADFARERAQAKPSSQEPKTVERANPLEGLLDKNFPGSTPLFGSKFRLGFGGYVKLDILHDFSGTGNRYSFSLASIPPRDAPHNSQYVTISARESRFHFEVRYGGPKAPLNQALIEMDFYSSNASATTAPRLRHAYVRWGDFLVGQTWALLSDLRPMPFIIDFAFADSINAQRVPQFRYQHSLTDHLGFRAGVEMPSLTGVDNPKGLPGNVSPRFPEFALGFSWDGPLGSVSWGGGVGMIRWDGLSEIPNQTSVSWAAAINGRLFFDRKHSGFVGMHGFVSRGGGQQIGLLTGQNSNAVLHADGKLEPLIAYQWMWGAQYQFVPALSMNIAAAANFLQPSSEQSSDTLETTWTLHTNIVGHINEPLQVGVEWMWGYARFANGDWGTAERIQGMAMYSF